MLEKSDYKKDNSVELDTDGIEEQSIQVENKEVESDDTKLPNEEVDLGYTEPKAAGIEGITIEEAKEEDVKVKKSEEDVDDLSSVSEKVRKRIDKLTFKVREAERREQAALDYAKNIQSKLDDTQSRFSKTSKSYIEQYSARVTAEQEKAKQALRDAIAEQDADKIAEANTVIAHLAVEAEKAKMTKQEYDSREESEAQDKRLLNLLKYLKILPIHNLLLEPELGLKRMNGLDRTRL